MIKINLIGPIFGTSGYDSHTRNLANALYKVADIKLTTQPIPNWERLVNDAELDMMTKPERFNDINIINAMPHAWKLMVSAGKNIGYCIWEGDKVPQSWIEDFLNPKIDYIFVPSEHTQQAIINTCADWSVIHSTSDEHLRILEKIKIIPHGVDRSIFHSQQDSSGALRPNDHEGGQLSSGALRPNDHEGGQLADTFKFICNKGWRGTSWDRGGVQYVVKAFAEEFSKDEKVELIIKLNPAYISPTQIGEAMKALNLVEDHPRININCDNLPFNKLPLLYQQADCFVCATRSEAFNLPGLEAMACGLPTIQTNFGGQTDYMNSNNSLFIDWTLEAVKEDMMYESISWATPSISSIRKQLRWAFENQDKIKEMGKQAEEDSKKWSWDASAKKIIDALS